VRELELSFDPSFQAPTNNPSLNHHNIQVAGAGRINPAKEIELTRLIRSYGASFNCTREIRQRALSLAIDTSSIAGRRFQTSGLSLACLYIAMREASVPVSLAMLAAASHYPNIDRLFSYFKRVDCPFSGMPDVERYLPVLVTSYTSDPTRRESLTRRSKRLVDLAKYCWFDQGRRCQSVCGAAFYFAIAVDLCGLRPNAKLTKWIADRLCVTVLILNTRIKELKNVMVS
jgi:transcription initiation factor TFIIIB Brf1 subunit/transcription initiation factor TFIIB